LVKRALEIRAAVGSSSVKKVFAMLNQATRADRLHDLFTGHGARTGRPTGNGPQPTNLPNSGPEVVHCSHCRSWYPSGPMCTTCGTIRPGTPKMEGYDSPTDWNADAASQALQTISHRSLEHVERIWGDAMYVVAGCLRALFTAAPGKELMSSDYTAIEAVVNAALSGEQWRMDVFRSHGKIYEASAAAMFKIDLSTLLAYPKTHGGSKHPLRAKGKVAELALGYLGWIGALRDMGGYEGTDQEAEDLCKAWREANPNIVYLGGGQFIGRGYERRPLMHGLEGMAISAVQNPGVEYLVARKDGTQSGLAFICTGDVLYMRLPSGRRIAYHRPRVTPAQQSWRGLSMSYEGFNTNPKNGPRGWIRMYTYAGKLLENACQAVANDILRHGQIQLEHAGYEIVLHVYDENVAEIPAGTGSIEQFESLMNTLPTWAADSVGPWPIKASGGWRGQRYRK
jgi:DNA polymerase